MVTKKILIVEDEDPLRNILEVRLKREGFSTLTAKDGEEGLRVSLKEEPDLILLDLLMPKMNGMVVLKRLRESVWGKTVPVLVLSNDDGPEHITETLKDNATDYLIKADWKLEDIVKKIRETLKT
jgi:DNA-binding response OmpR family regulator